VKFEMHLISQYDKFWSPEAKIAQWEHSTHTQHTPKYTLKHTHSHTHTHTHSISF